MTPNAQERSDDDLFGIDLGPAGEPIEGAAPDETSTPTPPRQPSRTLTERLATAAADRDDAAARKTRQGWSKQ